MTPDQLFRDPQLEHVIISLRQDEKTVIHRINVGFDGRDIRPLDSTQLAAWIQFKVDKAKNDLATVVQRSIP